jgi:ribose 5-phosphate isomerase A
LQDAERLKREAARRALDLVRPGMRLGLGTGSTARHFVDLLGEQVAAGLDVIGVPTSEKTKAQAESLGICLSTLEETPELDLTVDGADEVDPQLRLIKGGGGALLREKIVAAASKRMVVIADDSKLVERLGRFPLPIEVVSFGLAATRRHIVAAAASCGCRGEIRLRLKAEGDAPFVTDGGHNILDCAFGAIEDPVALAAALQPIPGVVDHGLFIDLARAAVLASASGVKILGDLA